MPITLSFLSTSEHSYTRHTILTYHKPNLLLNPLNDALRTKMIKISLKILIWETSYTRSYIQLKREQFRLMSTPSPQNAQSRAYTSQNPALQNNESFASINANYKQTFLWPQTEDEAISRKWTTVGNFFFCNDARWLQSKLPPSPPLQASGYPHQL